MDKKVFLAVIFCAAIFLIWQTVYLQPQSVKQSSPSSLNQKQNNVSNSEKQENILSQPQQKSEELVFLGDESYRYSISTQGGTIQNIELLKYRGQKVGNLQILIAGGPQLDLTTPSSEWEYLSSVKYKIYSKELNKEGRETLVLGYSDSQVSIVRKYLLRPDIFSLDHEIGIDFKKQPPNYLFVGLRTLLNVPKEQQENERREIYFNKQGGQDYWVVSDVDKVKEDLGEGRWAGISSRYFLNALVDNGAFVKPQFQSRPLGNGFIAVNFIYKLSGPSSKIPVRMYYGPKDTDILEAAGKSLNSAVDFGWFTIFAYPLLTALKWFNQYVHNFGIAIILLTLLVKILTYPLTVKSIKSMKQMQRIQPQLNKLREKYKEDKEKLNKETLQFMRANGYNPMSGCLPILIQMPIFIALYNVLYGAIDLYGQPFFGWIQDLSAKDPYFVTPILLALTMYLQQKLTPTTAADPTQQKIMNFMPIIFGFMMLWLPSGLTLYMLVNSITSIIQQVWLNKKFGIGSNAGATVSA